MAMGKVDAFITEYCQAELLDYDKDVYKEYGIYVKPHGYTMSSRKLESLQEIANVQAACQMSPQFTISTFFNIDPLDSQLLMLEKSWVTPNILVVATRGLGKSTIIDLGIMAKNLAFCSVWSYIASGTGGQAEQTFQTLERLANDQIESFYNSTGSIFLNEVAIKNAIGSGFVHAPGSFSYETYAGSMTKTLSSNIDAKRGARGSVIFDECGFLSDEMINVYGAFAVVNKNLKTGRDKDGHFLDPVRQRTIPQDLPYQKYYISSASSTDTKFYRLYRDFAKQQIMGNPDYAILHIDCEQAFKPTLRGELIAPLLSRETVATEMRTNPEKARREYYCIFTTDAGNDAIIKRSYIQRNEEVRKPDLANPDGKRKYIISYDPARSFDNSAILVGEIYESPLPDGTKELKCRLVNSINLMDVGKKIKSPMRTPEQVEYLKKIILDYNGGADNYENILAIYIDAGSGGGGVNIADYLVEDWTDSAGIAHRGLIDKEYDPEITKRFPNAVNKLHLMQPTKYRSEMFEAMIEMISQDKVSFTATYDGKDYLSVFDVDEEVLTKAKADIEKKLKKKDLSPEDYKKCFDEELSKIESIKTKQVKLDWMDKIALANMDAMKEEMVNMVRTKTASGRDTFNLVPEKARKMHDDRCYTATMLCYGLLQERRKSITQRRPQGPSTADIEKLMQIRAPKRRSRF